MLVESEETTNCGRMISKIAEMELSNWCGVAAN